jgi:hypothetical protein
MSELRPVPDGYDPGYPKGLSEEEIERLLRPGLLERFGARALAAGALVAGLSAVPLAAPVPVPAEGKLPKAGTSTRTDAKHRERVERITREMLGDKVGFWNQHTYLALDQPLKANPPVKVPVIPISFGNSYVGIFDTAKGKEATHRLFAAWGLKLERDVIVKGEGYTFRADGYDKTRKVGFRLLLPEGPFGRGGKLPAEKEPEDSKLDPKEMVALDRDVKAGKVRVFVADAMRYPNMDGDLYTPMQYYLASVVDYLNFIHGDRMLDRNTVLGKVPTGKPRRP